MQRMAVRRRDGAAASRYSLVWSNDMLIPCLEKFPLKKRTKQERQRVDSTTAKQILPDETLENKPYHLAFKRQHHRQTD